MLALLDDWQAQGMLRYIDVALARFLAQEVQPRHAPVQAGEAPRRRCREAGAAVWLACVRQEG